MLKKLVIALILALAHIIVIIQLNLTRPPQMPVQASEAILLRFISRQKKPATPEVGANTPLNAPVAAHRAELRHPVPQGMTADVAYSVENKDDGSSAIDGAALTTRPEHPTLDLQVKRDWLRNDKPTVQELARSDPRSNSVKLTISEQFAMRLGTQECVFQERLPDGTIYRGPGRWAPVQNLHNAVGGGTGTTKLCVRY